LLRRCFCSDGQLGGWRKGASAIAAGYRHAIAAFGVHWARKGGILGLPEASLAIGSCGSDSRAMISRSGVHRDLALFTLPYHVGG